MADGAESYSVRRSQWLGPVYAHPAFPTIVAAWFAALLGAGSLILPADFIGRVARASGVGDVLPVTAEPLSFAARATLAIAGALAGMALGLTLARRVVRLERMAALDGAGERTAPPCRPIDVAEDLGEEGIAPTDPADGRPQATSPLREAVDPAERPALETDIEMPAGARPSLDDLGLMQLTARLGSSLNARRTRLAPGNRANGEGDRPSALAFDPFEASDAHEAAQAIADFFAPSAVDDTCDDREEAGAPSVAGSTAPVAAPTALPGLGWGADLGSLRESRTATRLSET